PVTDGVGGAARKGVDIPLREEQGRERARGSPAVTVPPERNHGPPGFTASGEAGLAEGRAREVAAVAAVALPRAAPARDRRCAAGSLSATTTRTSPVSSSPSHPPAKRWSAAMSASKPTLSPVRRASLAR